MKILFFLISFGYLIEISLNTVKKELLTLAGHYGLWSENWSEKTAVL